MDKLNRYAWDTSGVIVLISCKQLYNKLLAETIIKLGKL